MAERLGAAELGFCFGFPYADFAGCGVAIGAFADTQARADAAADAFLAYVNAQEALFVQDTMPSAAAVQEAMRGRALELPLVMVVKPKLLPLPFGLTVMVLPL